MFKPQCDPMAGVVVGAVDDAMSSITQSLSHDHAQDQARSVIGDLMGWGSGMEVTSRPVGGDSYGSLMKPDTSGKCSMRAQQQGTMFGW